MGFNLSEIIQSQGLRLVFSIQDDGNLKRGILLSFFFAIHLIHRAQPAEVPATTQQSSGHKSFFSNFAVKRSRRILGCPLQGGAKDPTLFSNMFPDGFSSRIEMVSAIIRGHTHLPPHMPSWCFLCLCNAFKYWLWLACKVLCAVVPFKIKYKDRRTVFFQIWSWHCALMK